MLASRLNSCARKSSRRPTRIVGREQAARAARYGCAAGRAPRAHRRAWRRAPPPDAAGPDRGRSLGDEQRHLLADARLQRIRRRRRHRGGLLDQPRDRRELLARALREAARPPPARARLQRGDARVRSPASTLRRGARRLPRRALPPPSLQHAGDGEEAVGGRHGDALHPRRAAAPRRRRAPAPPRSGRAAGAPTRPPSASAKKQLPRDSRSRASRADVRLEMVEAGGSRSLISRPRALTLFSSQENFAPSTSNGRAGKAGHAGQRHRFSGRLLRED